jgi:hypothetical protein
MKRAGKVAFAWVIASAEWPWLAVVDPLKTFDRQPVEFFCRFFGQAGTAPAIVRRAHVAPFQGSRGLTFWCGLRDRVRSPWYAGQAGGAVSLQPSNR